MKIRKIPSDLYTAIDAQAKRPQTQETEATPQQQQSVRAQAVELAAGFGNGVEGQAPTDRAAKVAELKQKIADGSYRPDSQEVAKAFIKEMFF